MVGKTAPRAASTTLASYVYSARAYGAAALYTFLATMQLLQLWLHYSPTYKILTKNVIIDTKVSGSHVRQLL